MMSVPTRQAPMRPPRAGVDVYRLDVDQYLKMIEAGIFREGDRVELLGGILVRKMTKHEPHNYAIARLGDDLRGLLPGDWLVSEEKSIQLGRRWRPEPDLAVVRGPRTRYRSRAPRADDIAMLAEVADSSRSIDRGIKWRRYAASGIAVFWIIDIPRRVIEVHSRPSGRGAAAKYGDLKTYGDDGEIPVVIDGREVGRLAVRDYLP